MKLLGIDTESSTGIGNSILTLNMSIIDDNFDIAESLNLKLKPDPIEGRSLYTVDAEAMEVNKIDLAKHDAEAITYKQSKTIIYEWLEQMYEEYGFLTPFGNCIQGDIDSIIALTITKNSWNNFVSYNSIELLSIGNFLKFAGKIPEDQSLSLSKLAEFLGVKIDTNLVHSAEYDVWIGAQIIKYYFELLKNL